MWEGVEESVGCVYVGACSILGACVWEVGVHGGGSGYGARRVGLCIVCPLRHSLVQQQTWQHGNSRKCVHMVRHRRSSCTAFDEKKVAAALRLARKGWR